MYVRRHRVFGVPFVVHAIIAAVLLPATARAQEQECGGTAAVSIVNAGFEEPRQVAFRSSPVDHLPGWEMADTVSLAGADYTFDSDTQYIMLYDGTGSNGSVSQALDGAALRGEQVTLEIIALRSGWITLGTETIALNGSGFATQTHTVTFTVPADAPDALVLTLSSNGGNLSVDQISGWHTVTCDAPIVVDPVVKQDCMNGGYAAFGFKNQGLCIQFVNTGKDSRD